MRKGYESFILKLGKKQLQNIEWNRLINNDKFNQQKLSFIPIRVAQIWEGDNIVEDNRQESSQTIRKRKNWQSSLGE